MRETRNKESLRARDGLSPSISRAVFDLFPEPTKSILPSRFVFAFVALTGIILVLAAVPDEDNCGRGLGFKEPRQTDGDARIDYDGLNSAAPAFAAPILI